MKKMIISDEGDDEDDGKKMMPATSPHLYIWAFGPARHALLERKHLPRPSHRPAYPRLRHEYIYVNMNIKINININMNMNININSNMNINININIKH